MPTRCQAVDPTCVRRRTVVAGGAAALVLATRPVAGQGSRDAADNQFIAAAERMKAEAAARGDQAFGAVMVKDGAIVGWGPSRVVIDRNGDAHAERVALRDAQKRLDVSDLTGAVIYSTSRPCGACQDALARAGVARMIHGAGATDAGPPRRW